mgnify:CR=1 FL=1
MGASLKSLAINFSQQSIVKDGDSYITVLFASCNLEIIMFHAQISQVDFYHINWISSTFSLLIILGTILLW